MRTEGQQLQPSGFADNAAPNLGSTPSSSLKSRTQCNGSCGLLFAFTTAQPKHKGCQPSPYSKAYAYTGQLEYNEIRALVEIPPGYHCHSRVADSEEIYSRLSERHDSSATDKDYFKL